MRQFTKTGVLITATLVAGLVAGCSSGGGGGGSSPPSTISVSVPTPISELLPFAAQELGYFKANKVSVNIVASSAETSAALVTSGKVDLADYAAPTALLIAGQGKPTSIIFGDEGAALSGLLVSSKYNSLAQLQGLKSCTVGTFPPGSLAYLYASLYKKKLNLNCTITTYGSGDLLTAALLSNRVDAEIGSYSVFAQVLSSNKAHTIINTGDPAVAQKYLGDPILGQTFFGLTANLKRKSTAVTAFVKSITQAAAYIKSHSASAVAALLKKNSAYDTFPTTVLEANISFLTPLLGLGSPDGRISEANWKSALALFVYAGLPNGFNLQSSANSYSARVDMSYYDKANG